MDTLRNFRRHAGIQLNRNDLLGLLKDFNSKVACTGTDFENNLQVTITIRTESAHSHELHALGTYIALLEICFLHDSLKVLNIH